MHKTHTTCAFIVLYFGALPDYFDFWARSCESNHADFHWFVYNDSISEVIPFNPAVTLVPYGFAQLCQEIEAAYQLPVPSESRGLVCDYELLLASLKRDDDAFHGFDFVGFTDLDVIYGDIRRFLPDDALDYAMISADDDRPCGPFMLFNRKYADRIFRHDGVVAWLKSTLEKEVWQLTHATEAGAFEPMTGSRKKDALVKQTRFRHLDESETLMKIAAQFAPVLCRADPLQPTMTKGFNFRKAFAVWEEGSLKVHDNRGHTREGAFFHFSRFKKRARFKIDPAVSRSHRWGIYKYGIREIASPLTLMKMWGSLFY